MSPPDQIFRDALRFVTRVTPGAASMTLEDYGGLLSWRTAQVARFPRPIRALTNGDEGAPWRIVAVPGAPSFAEFWCGFAKRMIGLYEVIAVQRPGYLGSGQDRPAFGVEAQAEAILPFMERRPGQRILLIGHSFSAATALHLASVRAGAADALMLLCGLYDKPTRHLDIQRRFFDATGLKDRLGPSMQSCIEEVGSHPDNRRAAIAAAENLVIPTAVVHGTWDDVVPVSAAEKFMAILPDAASPDLRLIARGGHYPNYFQMRRMAIECGRLAMRAERAG